MLSQISTTNIWILAVGVALVAVNLFASSRLAPGIAAMFTRLSSHRDSRHA